MKRPQRIFELLGKIADGTFLNEKEFRELETYIGDVEHYVPDCPTCRHSMMNHHVADQGKAFVIECYETSECPCVTAYSESTKPAQSKR